MQLFTKEEMKDLALSVVAITLIFSFIPFTAQKPGIDWKMLPSYAAIVVITFVFHELAHKFVAMRFKTVAIYKIWPQGILFGLLLMTIGLKFVAPGAVMIYPYQFGRWGLRTKRLTLNEGGLISLVGPLVNIFFAVLFSFFSGTFAATLSFVNAWIAFINLLPVPPLDGSKIMLWRWWVWGIMMLVAGILVIPYLFG